MSSSNDSDLERLAEFCERLSIYINQYMDEEKQDKDKLNQLDELYKKINRQSVSLLAGGFHGWTKETEALHQVLQEKNEEITALIQEIDWIKRRLTPRQLFLASLIRHLNLRLGLPRSVRPPNDPTQFGRLSQWFSMLNNGPPYLLDSIIFQQEIWRSQSFV